MAKRKKGQKTSNIEKRKAEKKQKYAAMRESAKGSEPGTVSLGGRGRSFTKSEHYCKHERRNERRANAVENREAWDKLTPQEKIQRLNYRLGKGVGAKRERERITKCIN